MKRTKKRKEEKRGWERDQGREERKKERWRYSTHHLHKIDRRVPLLHFTTTLRFGCIYTPIIHSFSLPAWRSSFFVYFLKRLYAFFQDTTENVYVYNIRRETATSIHSSSISVYEYIGNPSPPSSSLSFSLSFSLFFPFTSLLPFSLSFFFFFYLFTFQSNLIFLISFDFISSDFLFLYLYEVVFSEAGSTETCGDEAAERREAKATGLKDFHREGLPR